MDFVVSILIFFLFTYLLGTIRAVTDPLELTSTYNGNPLYGDQVITFTCTTRGSPTLAWSSDHYIGVGSLLEFVALDTQGISQTSTINKNTIATLTMSYNDGGNQGFVLQSTLRIMVSSVYLQSNVTCHNVGQNLKDNITFRVFDTPAQELNSSLQGSYACPGDRINFTCTTHGSPILAWKSKQYIGDGNQLEFLSLNLSGMLLTSANTSAMLVSVSTANGMVDIVSILSITVLANLGDMDVHKVTCINVGTGTRDTITFEVARADCIRSDSSPILPTTDRVRVGGEGARSDTLALALGIALVVVAVMTGIIVMIISLVMKRKRDTKIKQDIMTNREKLLEQLPSDSVVHHQWRRFGQKAKLTEKVLDKIDKAKTDDRLSLVLDHWIRNSREKQRAWTDMVEILKAMNQYQLADDIELKNTNQQEFRRRKKLRDFSAQLQQPLTYKNRWRKFGKAVNIEEEVLDDIATSTKDHRVSRMLEYWLNRETEERTWKEVAEVLKEIGCRRVADDIERIFMQCVSTWSLNQPREGNPQLTLNSELSEVDGGMRGLEIQDALNRQEEHL